ncbi:helix-turn-helix domain-containing protein [Clavibacter michiganensis]|uniref:XRE family transcriptional regulator n=3 Tax=Clavibacter michiganensis TaxID=28447 RepID=A0A0D5CHT7_9MICO|nr:helix-turn-helix domain-containing protein [Clavibacter michiganensis]AJW78827.1 XRE family transcriptional regulator [Clavibacter michiganensis subsp. insidiosus]AWF98510.1 XRE family transcriptional regulator [Clavibacter michiganensis subsp. insidiosus]AWG01289.1 XRE family transcriptional regulator [Clavibacter michiganensis subsp. insidiosus]OQJ60164.1 XRE family transcriptional regulator [Clavibacter michiganensis subsp. insidiosus]RMC84093.1 helix-turn-helix domain-containing protein
MDQLVIGRRIRHARKGAGLTLQALGERAGILPSQLSMIENGRRETRLSTLGRIAGALGVDVTHLLAADAPDARSALEIELDRAQRSSLYGSLGLPAVPASRALPQETLEALVGLHRELARRERESIATPEEARRANTEQRLMMRERHNHIPAIEELAERMLADVGHRSGALSHRSVSRMAEGLGFELIYVDDLPRSTRSVTDLGEGRIYLPPASIPGGHGLRSMALQAMAHRVLGHEEPASYADFLRQRLEINYFAAACLMPLTQSVEFLAEAKARRDLAVEDFRDAFGVTHEAAALRLTNISTTHLDLRVHFLRVGGDGAVYKAYENDGLPLPVDVTGAVEGQPVCREWAARGAFDRTNRTTEFHQYTDTPAGTFWCSTQTGSTAEGEYSISFGVPFAHAKWFRGRETTARSVSRCPDESCCRRADPEDAGRWRDRAWPSARLHAHILAPLPRGSFPGVDDRELYAFLDRHAGA